MEKRNTIETRFIKLRQVFHDFQTSVRFSTANSQIQVFANHLKCYQFLGQLQEHFISQKVPHLYEFVHSIFSLVFTMIRQGPSSQVANKSRLQIPLDDSKKVGSDIGVQTQEASSTTIESKKKVRFDQGWVHAKRGVKRSCMEIQIFEKDLAQMDFRQRRRALKKMRDVIYEEDEIEQPNSFLKQFKPNVQKVGYSKSDESIKSAIDKFKQSDISTHIFLKHFMSQYSQLNDIKCSSELLNKQLLQSMSKAVNKYKQVKTKQKQKLRVFNHVVEEVVYSTAIYCNEDYSISVSDMKVGVDVGRQDNQGINKVSKEDCKESGEVNKFVKSKSKLQRRNFPSILVKRGSELNPISQIRSQSSTITSKLESQTSSSLLSLSIQQQQKKIRSRSSFRMSNSMNSSFLQSFITPKQKQNFVQKLQNSNNTKPNKKLHKRGGSQSFQNIQNKFNRKSLQVGLTK